MKKALIIIVIILAVIVALPLINLVSWYLQPKKAMDIILVDKTVPTLERYHHRSFSWILTNGRFVKGDEKSYCYKKDYYGFFPLKPISDRKWERNEYRLTDVINLAETNDAVYFADTYGVFFNDWYRGLNKTRRPRKIYGGLTNNDFLLIKEMKDRNRLIILEYNTFDYPASAFDSYRTQEKLGLTFTGWTGKYFSSLDSTGHDFPMWMTEMYRKEHRSPWNFDGPGLVMLNQKSIIVLAEGAHVESAVPKIVTGPDAVEKYGVNPSVAFDNWFDVVDPVACKVLASYQISTTEQGDSLLMNYNLSNSFPAVVQDNVSPNVYYFAGNFAYNTKPFWTARFNGMDKVKRFLYSDKPDDPRRFFWLFYKPLLNTIFSDYYGSLNKN
jgi:hypothetical protein